MRLLFSMLKMADADDGVDVGEFCYLQSIWFALWRPWRISLGYNFFDVSRPAKIKAFVLEPE